MTDNEKRHYKIASEIARSGDAITKTKVRAYIRKMKFTKDGISREQRVQVINDLASRFLRKIMTRPRASPPGPCLNVRLTSFKRNKFMTKVREAGFRTPGDEYHHNYMQFVDDVSLVNAVWWNYSFLRDGVQIIENEHRYFIMHDWGTTVDKQGISVLNGKLTLHASEPAIIKDDKLIYEAIWAEQGENLSLICKRGFVGIANNFFVHADTEEESINSLLKQ